MTHASTLLLLSFLFGALAVILDQNKYKIAMGLMIAAKICLYLGAFRFLWLFELSLEKYLGI